MRARVGVALAMAVALTTVGCSAPEPEETSALTPTSTAFSVSTSDLLSIEAPAMCGRERGGLVDGSLPVDDPIMNGFTELALDEAAGDEVLWAAGTTAMYPSGVVGVVFRCSAGGVGFPEVLGFYDADLALLASVDLGELDEQEHSNVTAIDLTDEGFEVEWFTNGEPCHFGADASIPRAGTFVIEGGGVTPLKLMTGESTVACADAGQGEWLITSEGIGPLRFGMTIAQAEASSAWTHSDLMYEGCPAYGFTRDHHYVTAYMFDEWGDMGDDPGSLSMLSYSTDESPSTARTPDGIGIGSQESSLTSAYGSRLIEVPIGEDPLDWYEYMGVTAIYALDDGERAIVFGVGQDSTVFQINVGETGLRALIYEACG